MLDPARPNKLDLTDFATYINSCLALAKERLSKFADLEEVGQAEDDLNRYPRLDKLQTPHSVVVLDGEFVGPDEIGRAVEALLDGKVLLEHACAGEATRLGLGTKYLISPRVDLGREVLIRLAGEEEPPVDPLDMTYMSLGRRHMLQLAWDLSRLAEDHGRDPDQVLKSQHLLIIVNEATAHAVELDFHEAAFYGFDPAKVLFMVQKSFHGITRGEDGSWAYDPFSPPRLHNHGQMLLQTTMDQQLFRVAMDGSKTRLDWADYRALLEGFLDKISFNIEDLDYLRHSLDLEGLAAALKLADDGFRMVMEVVANNPDHPQKGGALYHDPELGRDVMIESFQLKGVDPAEISHLNKNINHYPRPAEAVGAAHEKGLAMPLAVKESFLYFQPVQGDVNFLVPTAFLRRPAVKPISAWKSGANTFAALQAMRDQETREGFLAWASGLTGLKF